MIYEQGKSYPNLHPPGLANNQVQLGLSSPNMTPKQVEPRLQGDLIIGTIKTAR